MDFDLGKQEKHTCEQLRQLAQGDLRACLKTLGSEDHQKAQEALLDAFRLLVGTGYIDLVLNRKAGGSAVVAVREELATLSPSLFFCLEAGNGLLVRLLAHYGNEDQKAQLLPDLAWCRTIGTVATVEEHGNIEDNPFQTAAVKEGDGLVVSGEKRMVINAPVAHWMAVACTVEGGLAFALIPAQAHGLSVGSRLPLVGLEQAPFYSISLDKVPLSPGQLVGPFESNQPLEQLRLWEDEILVCASLGIMRRAYQAARDHAKSHQCGNKPLVAYQEVGFKLAEMLTLVQTSQLLAYRAGWMGQSGDREAGVLLRCAKVFCAESAEKVASGALQILGTQGYLRGNPAEEAYRDAKYVHIAGTSTERSRMKIGDRVLEVF